MTEATKGRFIEKLYHELGFETLESRSGIVNFVAPLKFVRLSHLDIYYVIPSAKRAYITRNNDKLSHFKVRNNHFENSFFLSMLIELNILDLSISNFGSLTSFKGSKASF